MDVVLEDSPQDVATFVARGLCDLVSAKGSVVLGLATGGSPLPTYAAMARIAEEESIDFAGVRVVMLDEYLGLPERHEARFRNVLRGVIDPLGIPGESVIELPYAWPNGEDPGADPTAELRRSCERFEAEIHSAGGIDVQLLGIGANGHIGFNEPSSSLASRTRVVMLTESTREANARHFPGRDAVPTHAVTQGVGTILEARHLVLIATGTEKASIVARAIEGPVTALVPASALQLHPRVTVVLDEPAAERLVMADHHRRGQANLPQGHRFLGGPWW